MLENIFGVIAGVLTTIRFLPQVYHMVRIKETRSLSMWFLVVVLFQSIFLMLYGFTKPDLLILWMNLMPLLCSIILIGYKLRFR